MADQLTAAELAAIRSRVEATPHGPWHVETFPGRALQRVSNAEAYLIAETFEAPEYPPAMAEFIAHARTDIPALLDALESADRPMMLTRWQLDLIGRLFHGAGVGDHPYVVVEAVPPADHPDGAIVGLAHGGGIEPDEVTWILQCALDKLRPEAAASRADLQEAIGVILANHVAAGEVEPYLDTFAAQDLADEILVKAVGAVLDKHRQALVDEQGSHAMTCSNFTDYAEDKQREVARLGQLLAAAQLDRDQAQADARAALTRAEQLAGVLAEVLKRMWIEHNDAGFVSYRTEWVPAATVAEWRWVLAGPVDGDG